LGKPCRLGGVVLKLMAQNDLIPSALARGYIPDRPRQNLAEDEHSYHDTDERVDDYHSSLPLSVERINLYPSAEQSERGEDEDEQGCHGSDARDSDADVGNDTGDHKSGRKPNQR